MSAWRFTGYAALIAAVVFAAVAPTLSWLQFAGGSENLVVGTVLEMKRGGPWLVPTLKGAPRTTKPPLTTWLCASLVSDRTIQQLSDPALRDAAYRKLSWEVRWPALVSGCLFLIVIAWLGRILFGDAVGLSSAIIAATTFLFLRFTRLITTDIYLALWVALANLCWIASWKMKRDSARWALVVAGAVSLALALMTKGPVALTQTVFPLALFVAWKRQWKLPWLRIAVATVIVLALALPWPVLVVTRLSGQMELWVRDTTRIGAKGDPADPQYSYFIMLWVLLPWLFFMVLGGLRAVKERSEPGVLALLLSASPIIVMTFFPDKNERYLLPMLAPAAVLAAWAFNRRDPDVDPGWNLSMALTWGLLGIIAIGCPIIGIFLRSATGARWWPIGAGIAMAIAGAFVVVISWRWDRVRERGVLACSLMIMLAAQAMFVWGYGQISGGLSDMKPLADAIANELPANAEVWGFTEPGRFSKVPIDFPIYLNRTVREATTPTTLPSSPPQVMLVFRTKNEPPISALANWRLIGAVPRRNQGFWEAYTRPQ